MIFVTGGTGLLGNSIVRELVRRRLPVRVLCRPGTSREAFDGLDVEIVAGDLSSTDVLNSAIAGCSAVVHCAAFIHLGWHKLAQSRQVNVAGTQAIVDACSQHAARMIYVSTVDTLPSARSLSEPIDERLLDGVPTVNCSYVVSKTEGEQVVRAAIERSGLDAVIMHPGFMLGPYDWKPSSGRMFLQVVKSPVIFATSGGCSLCDARNVAAACVNAIELGQAGQHYIVAGENLSYLDLWKRMLRIAGKPKLCLHLPYTVKLFGATTDLLFRLFPGCEGDVNGATIAMGNLNHYYSSAKAQRELDYNPLISDANLAEIWDWLQTHHAAN